MAGHGKYLIDSTGKRYVWGGKAVALPYVDTLLDGLVAYFTLAEGELPLVDQVGGFNFTTDTSTPTYGQPGKITNSVLFDGTNEFVSGADTADDFQTGSFTEYTVSFWVKVNTLPSAAGHKYRVITIGGNAATYVELNVTDGIMASTLIGAAQKYAQANDGVIAAIDTWYHVVVVFKQGTTPNKVYINGADETVWGSTMSGAFDAASGNTFISYVTTNNVDGYVCELGLWSRALTTYDVSALYNDGYGITYPFTEFESYLEVLNDGNTWAWYNDSSTTMTIADASVSQWNDYLNSGNNLLQAVGLAQPEWSADGITFDGENDFMLSETFSAISQPTSIYMVVTQSGWAEYSTILANGDWSVKFFQFDVTPKVAINAGTSSARSSDLIVGTPSVIRMLFNGTSSKFTVDEHTTIEGDFGSGTSIDQISIGGDAAGDGPTNVVIKEIIIRDVVDSTANESMVYEYLKAKYGL